MKQDLTHLPLNDKNGLEGEPTTWEFPGILGDH